MLIEGDHFQGTFGTFGAFVAMRATGAVEGFLKVVDGEDAEHHGDVAVAVEGGDALRHALAHVVEMRRAAAYHAAEYDDGIEKLGLDKLRGGECKFNGAGDGENGAILIPYPMLLQCGHGRLGEPTGNIVVPLCGDYGDTHAFARRHVVFCNIL